MLVKTSQLISNVISSKLTYWINMPSLYGTLYDSLQELQSLIDFDKDSFSLLQNVVSDIYVLFQYYSKLFISYIDLNKIITYMCSYNAVYILCCIFIFKIFYNIKILNFIPQTYLMKMYKIKNRFNKNIQVLYINKDDIHQQSYKGDGGIYEYFKSNNFLIDKYSYFDSRESNNTTISKQYSNIFKGKSFDINDTNTHFFIDTSYKTDIYGSFQFVQSVINDKILLTHKIGTIDQKIDYDCKVINIQCKLQIFNKNINIMDYFNYFKKQLIASSERTTGIIDTSCKFYKCLEKIPVKYYKDMEYIEKQEKLFINTFYHPERDYLWKLIKNVHISSKIFDDNGFYKQCSFLLYGPSGTGKSSFAYRIAKTLGRSICQIDLRKINSKYDIKQILTNEITFKDGIFKSNDTVIVLDEFDLSIQYLKIKEDEKKKNKGKLQKSFDNYLKNTEASSVIQDNEISDFTKYNINGDNQGKQSYYYGTQSSYTCGNQGSSGTQGTQGYERMENTRKMNIENLYENESSITIDDLLEIFQGPYPNEGAIIIATTNNYNKIKNICPRLFRDGRLKPIYFGYPTKEIIIQIVKDYFDKDISNIAWIPKTLRIPQARIMYNIMEIMIYNDYDKNKSYCVFMEKLKCDFENYSCIEGYDEEFKA